MNFTPHAYQEKAISEVEYLLNSTGRALLISPISSGKTYIASAVAKFFADQGNVLFIVNRINLILQTYETLQIFGEDHAVIHAEVDRNFDGTKIENVAITEKKIIKGIRKHNKKVLITTVETLQNVLKFMKGYTPNLIIFDEAHKATSEGYQIVRDKYPNTKILGLTATPFRAKVGNGECLYEDWYGNNVVNTISIKELIELGQLTPPTYLSFHNDEHIARKWLDLTEGQENKRTLVFAIDTNHAMKILESFTDLGISADVITTSSETCDEATAMTFLQRNHIYKRFKDGKLDVIISIMALCEGFNEPAARYGFFLRRVGGEDAFNPSLWFQMVGRILRSFPGKQDAYIVDFCDNISRYGKVEDWEWDITEQGIRQTINVFDGESILKNTYNTVKRVYVTCRECAHVYDLKKTPFCPHCHTVTEVRVSATKSEHFKVFHWYTEYKFDRGRLRKSSPVQGLYDNYCRWLGGQAPSLNEFGECMTELEGLGHCRKVKDSYSKRIHYEPR